MICVSAICQSIAMEIVVSCNFVVVNQIPDHHVGNKAGTSGNKDLFVFNHMTIFMLFYPHYISIGY
jgi:hypothetical protein